MKARLAQILGLLGIFFLFAKCVPLPVLTRGMQPIVVALSIMAAAVLVRLNRGMPTLDWKSLEVVQRGRLTQKIVELSKDYLWIMTILALSTIYIVCLMTIGEPALSLLHPVTQMCLAGATGAMLYESFRRMGYVVWRDYDIIKLQKHLIDASGQSDHDEKQAKKAEENVATMKASGLKAPKSKPPTAW